jgi:peroxiredoxin
MKNRLAFISAIAIGILVAGFFYNKYRVAPKLKLETLKLTDLAGNKISLDSFQNKKLFLNFFATWCGPCVKELHSIALAQQILSKENFQFILISDEPTDRLLNFKEKSGIDFLILRSEKSLQEYQIFSIPTSYVLNAKHEVVLKENGEEDWASNALVEKMKRVTE